MLIGSYDGSLYALDTATGKQVWKVSTDNYVHATPAIWNGVAYFGGCDEYFHGVRIADGSELVDMDTGRVHAPRRPPSRAAWRTTARSPMK